MKKLIPILVIALVLSFPTMVFSLDFFDNLRRVGELGAEVESLKKENEKLRQDFSELSSKTEFNQLMIKLMFVDLSHLSTIFPQTASFRPSEKGYAVVSCANGYFAVSCKDIKSYSTGSEITIQIVNMLSVSATDVELKIAYAASKKFDEKSIILEEYTKSRVERVEKVNGDILPATAKLITVRAPEYKPEQVKLLEISVVAGGIGYKRGQ